jgi:hypothetical protein
LYDLSRCGSVVEMSETIIHLDQPSTQTDIETLYASERLFGDPQLIFEKITAVDWKVAPHPEHTVPIPLDELKKLLRLRLHYHTE